ncbi:MAG: tetratricopeptide repeat protein, partial [Limisphaerales bacterium]
MKRLQLIPQGLLNRRLQAAEAAWGRKDFQECIETLESARHLAPANTSILLQLGRVYGLRYDYAAAESCFEKIIRLAPQKTEALATIGRLCLDFGNYQMAEHYFQRAVDQKNAAPEIFAKLAELYERLHRAEDAAAIVERALHLNGTCALAWLIRAKLSRQAGRLEEAEQALRPALLSAERDIRVRSYYELGAILDRQGRYDEAMTAFLEAKKLLLPDAPPLLTQLQLIREHLKQMQNDISSEMLHRWFDSGREHLQPLHRLAFLGGHARSGTTLLEQVLDSHPDIVSAEETTI